MNKLPIKSPKYWGEKTVEIVTASIAAFILVSFLQSREDLEKSSVKAEDWFTVNSIYVPDHEVGANPIMVYDRSILETHRGFWVVEAQRQEAPGVARFFNECSGSGVDNYTETDLLPEEGVSWSWFFGRPCTVPPGLYRVEMTKDLSVPGYPVKSMLPVFSNTFRVYPPGALPD